MRTTAVETLKFVVRIALLMVVPQVILALTNAGGNWVYVANVLTVLLPIVDKWVHEDDRIPAKGLLPF
jgi:hypothetical protein